MTYIVIMHIVSGAVVECCTNEATAARYLEPGHTFGKGMTLEGVMNEANNNRKFFLEHGYKGPEE